MVIVSLFVIFERKKLPELDALQERILMRIIREKMRDTLFFSGFCFEIREELLYRMQTRNVSFEDIVLCLLQGKYGGNLEKGELDNEVKFRVVGRDSNNEPLCVVIAIVVTDSLCYKNWVFKLITTFNR